MADKRHNLPKLITVILVLVLIFLWAGSWVKTNKKNIIDGSMAFGSQKWTTQIQNNNGTKISLADSPKHSQNQSLSISNNSPNFSKYSLPLTLATNSEYEISCWVKTQDIGINNTGADLSVTGNDIAPYPEAYIKPLSNNGIGQMRYINIAHQNPGPLYLCSTDLTGTNSIWQNLRLHITTGPTSGNVVLSFELGRDKSLNTGKAWFTDLVVEKVNPSIFSSSGIMMQIAIIALLIIILGAVYLQESEITLNQDANRHIPLIIIFGLAIILRLVMAALIDGHILDVYCFKTWSSAASENLFSIYRTGMFLDYPPFYLYFLFIIGKIASLLNLYTVPWAYNVLLKLPSILAEIITGIIIYKASKSRFTFKGSLFITSIYLFSATLILETCAWGQMDSLFTLIIIGALVLIYQNKYALSSALFAAAVLTKPQGIIFLPILFFAVVKNKKVKTFIYSFLSMLATILLVSFPFLLRNGFLWIVKLYTGTLSEYTAAAQGSYNLFGLLGGEGKPDSSALFILSYNTWGFIFIILISCFVGYLYLKSENDFVPFLSSFVLMTGVFMLSSRMHERYLFPALAIGLMLFIFSNDKRILFLYGCFSVTLYESMDVDIFKVIILPSQLMSLINLVLFAYLIKVVIDIVIRRNIIFAGFDKPFQNQTRASGKIIS
ncbi:glycosyltransferase 87 family protein [Desulfosporosinus sp. FKA]|uniref:glycosyltransferase 87 family protein n=1 Tax=Desulfosporosinus sp. FKA TaxID=1969834 RepID=UPI000B4A0254|nr:glycosyltransferase 87 family protein [Desulfosporosinus sp. FKA]